MYFNSTFASFSDFSDKFSLPLYNLFRYFQVRHLLQHQDPNFPYLAQPSALDGLLKLPFNSKGLIARMDDYIGFLGNTTQAKISADWVGELGEDLKEDTWENALLRVNYSTSCIKLNFIQFEILHRVHFSKVKLAQIYSNIDANCDRCRNSPVGLSHMFWSCPALTTFWATIFKMLSKALNIDLQPNASMAIFGVTGTICNIRGKIQKHNYFYNTTSTKENIITLEIN